MLEFVVTLMFYWVTFYWTVYAAVSSASLSLLATGIDSVFDVGSNFLLYYINHKSSRMDVNKWPVGGARLETIGNVIYGTFFWHSPWISLILHPQVFCARSMFSVHWIAVDFALSMGSVNFIVIIESARDLLTHKNQDLNEFHLPSVIAVAAALGRPTGLSSLITLINSQVSNFFYSFTVTRYVRSRVRLRCSGRTTAMTYL